MRRAPFGPLVSVLATGVAWMRGPGLDAKRDSRACVYAGSRPGVRCHSSTGLGLHTGAPAWEATWECFVGEETFHLGS